MEPFILQVEVLIYNQNKIYLTTKLLKLYKFYKQQTKTSIRSKFSDADVVGQVEQEFLAPEDSQRRETPKRERSRKARSRGLTLEEFDNEMNVFRRAIDDVRSVTSTLSHGIVTLDFQPIKDVS